MNFMETSLLLGDALKKSMPVQWNGRTCILEMKEGGSTQWRQMEWTGFYFQFMCGKILCRFMNVPGTKYGNAEFDAFLDIPWDFKAHAMNSSSHNVIVNDREAIISAIGEFGAVGLILALGEVEYNDDDRQFQKWHSEQKGGISKYEKERKARGAWSRKRKVSFVLRQISFIPITEDVISESGSFQAGFRNSTGTPRRPKILVDLEKLNEENIHVVDF